MVFFRSVRDLSNGLCSCLVAEERRCLMVSRAQWLLDCSLGSFLTKLGTSRYCFCADAELRNWSSEVLLAEEQHGMIVEGTDDTLTVLCR